MPPLTTEDLTDQMIVEVMEDALAAGDLELAGTACRALGADAWQDYELGPEEYDRVRRRSVSSSRAYVLRYLHERR